MVAILFGKVILGLELTDLPQGVVLRIYKYTQVSLLDLVCADEAFIRGIYELVHSRIRGKYDTYRIRIKTKHIKSQKWHPGYQQEMAIADLGLDLKDQHCCGGETACGLPCV